MFEEKLNLCDRDLERIRIGLTIRQMRIYYDCSLKQLAELVNIDPANLSRIERGKYSVGYDILARIARVFDCKVGFIHNSFNDSF